MWIFIVVALIGQFMDYRMEQAGEWLPPFPLKIGWWSSSDQYISKTDLAILGNPKYMARVYTDPLGDMVSVSVFSASSMSTYHDPRSCSLGMGYTMTAQMPKLLNPGGPYARAMVFHRNNQRVIMYYWLQNRDGSVFTKGAIRHDLMTRLSSIPIIFNSVLTGRQTCVIRVYASIPPGDADGVRTRNNVAFFAHQVYQALKAGK